MAEEESSVDTVFCTAIDIESAEERREYVAGACGQDAQLRHQVDRLLRAHYGAGCFLESPPKGVGGFPTLAPPVTEKPGTQIGPYKLLQQLGEGGMGVVYMAEQAEPVERRVALKIIKPGMDTRQVIARFEAERQALAMMDHPYIAKALDAGATGSGRPYFVMELVKGVPVTEYCDEQHLTPKERLELFVSICQAVQHAHQKGIIHRDLKPSNILVARYDGRAIPKIIDFGVAKATSQTLTERTVFTQAGQVVGTLEYMSPEQAQVNQLDVDTRSDVYSLGVVLYELLTGDTPFDRTRLRSAAWDEMLRIVRDEEPPRPSTKLSHSRTLPSVAANRKIKPSKLSTLIRGELDWIVMKALEKDRSRRYETAAGLANDVQRYLHDEAVVACPPSSGYRFRKFARRNKAAIVTASLIALALICGMAGTSWQAIRARRAERIAQNNFESEQQARHQAVDQRHRAHRAEASAIGARDQAVKAEREAKQQLFNAYLAQAKATRRSGQPGQRIDALNAIRHAVRLIEPLGLGEEARRALRNEAIGALSLVDLSPLTRQRSLSNKRGWITVSEDCRFAAVDAGKPGPVRVYAIENPTEDIGRIVPTDESDYSYFLFLDPSVRYLLRQTAISNTCYVSDLSIEQDAFTVSNIRQAMAADFHPARAELVVGDMEGIVRFLELPSGNQLRQFSMNQPVNVVRYSPDGRHLALCGIDGPLEIRDAETGAVTLEVPSFGTATAAWRPDSSGVALGVESDIHLLNVGEQPGRHVICRGHQSTVVNLHFHPRNRLLASAAWDGTIRLWDTGNGHELMRLEGCCLRFSSDGRLLAGRQGLDLILWEVATPDTYRWLHKGMTAATAIAPDGRLVVSSHDDGVRLWDRERGTLVSHLRIGPTQDVAFHPLDGSLITSGAAGLYQWPVTTEDGESLERVHIGPAQTMEVGVTGSRMVSFSCDGGTLLVEANLQDEAIVAHVSETPWRKVRLTSRRLVNTALSPDGRWAAASCEVGRSITIWDANTGDQVCVLPSTSSAQVRFSPDNRWLVANSGTTISIREVGSWMLCHEIAFTSDAASGIAFTSDSRLVAVGLWGIGIHLIEVETGQRVALLEAVQRPPAYVDLNFSSDNTFLAAAVDHEGLCIWDMRAIRQRLAALGLDWNQPPLPEAEMAEPNRPIRVEIDLGILEQQD